MTFLRLVSRLAAPGVAISALAACSSGDTSATQSGSGAVVVDTSTPLARAQYDADVTFAQSYQPQCAFTDDGKPRVLLTGFGRFLDTTDNATGHLVASLVPGLTYPVTQPPPAGQIDPPGPQLAQAQAVVTLPQSGDVTLCALVVPTYWDLAAIVIAKELDAFQPNLLIMNGVADDVQPLWLELGAVNQAMAAEDGSNTLQPVTDASKLVPTASADDDTIGLFLSYPAVKSAALAAIAQHKDDADDSGRAFSDVVQGAELAGFPRSGNTYLCNNVAYVLGYLMNHPGQNVTLLQPSSGGGDGVQIALQHDTSATPRVFVHWPGTLEGAHLSSAAGVLGAMVDAQLASLASGDAPVVGTNAMAEIKASTGATF